MAERPVSESALQAIAERDRLHETVRQLQSIIALFMDITDEEALFASEHPGNVGALDALRDIRCAAARHLARSKGT